MQTWMLISMVAAVLTLHLAVAMPHDNLSRKREVAEQLFKSDKSNTSEDSNSTELKNKPHHSEEDLHREKRDTSEDSSNSSEEHKHGKQHVDHADHQLETTTHPAEQPHRRRKRDTSLEASPDSTDEILHDLGLDPEELQLGKDYPQGCQVIEEDSNELNNETTSEK